MNHEKKSILKSENVADEMILGALIGSSNLGLHVPFRKEDGESYKPDAPVNKLTQRMAKGVEYLLHKNPKVQKVVYAALGVNQN